MIENSQSRWCGIVLSPLGHSQHAVCRQALREVRFGPKTDLIRRTGNLRAVQLLLGHTKIESTVRYLGIEVDETS